MFLLPETMFLFTWPKVDSLGGDLSWNHSQVGGQKHGCITMVLRDCPVIPSLYH